ncbi:hypothetical protein [Rathayibacter sp. VKM Ac-2630]|uniref:hypothetical protein n=1 Tax=Rathayibacter sp. VKM Ac-2630 TaxID=1938617 RepID=UPI001300E463|nr:hypothetical protein [Rathayibacter sp. VKM Ac-2630]
MVTAYGTKTFAGVKPGASAVGAYTTRLARIPAGSATVTAASTGLTTTTTAPYAAR